MAACKLDLSRPCFRVSFDNLSESDEIKNRMLADFKKKVEKDHKSCHRVVQKFYGNKKYTHLHDKIWKYDWGQSSAANRKSWRMVVVVPEPHIEPYQLIAASIYRKNIAEQLSFRELASIFDIATMMGSVDLAAGPDEGKGEFRRVLDGDGKMKRSICSVCYRHVAVTEDSAELDKAEEQHRCDLAEATEETSN